MLPRTNFAPFRLLLVLLPLLMTAAASVRAADSLVSGDAAVMPAFHVTFHGSAQTAKTSDFSPPWTGNLWDADSTGEIFRDDAPVSGAKAVGLRTLTGKGSVQFYTWQPADVHAGRRYVVTCHYLTTGSASGALVAQGDGVEKKSVPLPGAKAWTAATLTLDQGADGKLSLLFQNYALGADNTLYLRDVSVADVGTAPVAVALPAAPAGANATSALPDLKPSGVAQPEVRAVVSETLPLHPKLILLGGDPDALLSQFQRNSVQGRAEFADVPVTGQPFAKAIRVDTDKKPQEWMTHLQSFTSEKIHRGDVLYVTAHVRAVRIQDGKDAGVARLYASEERGGNQHDSDSLYAGDFSVPKTWTRVHFPLVATRDFGPDDQLKLMWTFGQTAQVVEIGGIAALGYGPGVDKLALPHAALPLNYAGREPNAPWRQAAQARIEKYRKGDLMVKVTDAAGRLVPNAAVQATLTRQAFLWGSSTPVGMLPGQHVKPYNADFQRTAGASDADKKTLQDTFLRLFNATTQSVTWAVWDGADARISRDDILAGLTWFQQNGIPVLNSQVVYPGPEFTDPTVAKTLMTKDHAPEFEKAVDGFIAGQLSPPLGDLLSSVEIANEIEGRPQYTDVLGHEAVAGWFKTAQADNPKIGREINGPYSLGQQSVQTEGRGAAWPTTDGLQYYYDLIAYLCRQGAPIQYVGFQNHTGLGAPGPEAVLRSLDQFATLGLPLEVTEFEVTLQDGKDPAQRQYQADYVRDYLTAVFSHPSVRAVILQDFWQPGAWQYEGASAFFNADWSANPHEKVYEDLVRHQWWTRASGTTTRAGTYATRGFLGDYDITATAGGRTRTVHATLTRAGQEVKITLP